MFGIFASAFLTATRHDLPTRPAPHPSRRTGLARGPFRDGPPAR